MIRELDIINILIARQRAQRKTSKKHGLNNSDVLTLLVAHSRQKSRKNTVTGCEMYAFVHPRNIQNSISKLESLGIIEKKAHRYRQAKNIMLTEKGNNILAELLLYIRKEERMFRFGLLE